MSTIKISQLVQLNSINANTANTIMPVVDIPSGGTYKITATTLGQGLYYNNPLNVGINSIQLPNVIAQFSNSSSQYSQVNLQNFDGRGSGDYVITANNGTDTTYYVDVGINGSQYNLPSFNITWPNDGYIYAQGAASSGQPGGNLVIGATTTDKDIIFFQGGTTLADEVARFKLSTGFTLRGKPITFADGTSQNTAVQQTFVQASFDKANTTSGNTVALQTYSTLANGNIIALQTSSTLANGNIIALQTYSTLANGNIIALQTSSTLSNGNIIALQSQVLTLNANVAAVNTFSYGAYNQANSVNTYAYSANVFLQNYALANANNVLTAGVFNVGDKLNVNGSVIFANTNFSNTEAALTIAACPQTQVQLPSNDGYMIHISGKQNVSSRIVSDSFGANTYTVLAGRTARGTPIAPQAVANGDILLRMSGNGWGSTKWAANGSGRIDIVAAENFTDSARGTFFQIWNTRSGSNTLTEIARFNADSVTFTGAVYPQKGFIYSPLPYPGAQTAITIDFANNSVIKANTSAGITVSFSNITAGKVVEMWITNTAGTNQTFTHGCSALNSTVNSTTYTIPGTSSILARYMSFHTDTANVFVAIVK